MKIVELEYIKPRTLNYSLPVFGDEQSDENDPDQTERPGNDEPSDSGPGSGDKS